MNLKVLIFHDILLWYPHKKSEIMQIVKPAIIMMIVNTSTSYFSQNSVSLFQKIIEGQNPKPFKVLSYTCDQPENGLSTAYSAKWL